MQWPWQAGCGLWAAADQPARGRPGSDRLGTGWRRVSLGGQGRDGAGVQPACPPSQQRDRWGVLPCTESDHGPLLCLPSRWSCLSPRERVSILLCTFRPGQSWALALSTLSGVRDGRVAVSIS